MRRTIAIHTIAALLATGVLGSAKADIAPEDVLDPGARNADVQRASAWTRAQTDVLYLDPDADFEPDESTRIKLPDPPKDPAEVRQTDRWVNGLIFGAILIGIILLIYFQGGRIQVNFNRTGEERRAGAAGRDTQAGSDVLPEEGFLDRLAAMADRRLALILLTGRALERAASANDMTLARAQTARDVVRAVPRAWPHRDALAKLVRQAEVVHFGGRDITEDTWQDCLATAQPLFGRVAA
ncbi:MAG: DUF4129 domain-containing protein [Pseudomonadota bacterium]